MATLVPSPEIQQDGQTNGLYERDFYSWSMQQADALKNRDFAAIDWDSVSEEIQDLGVTQRNEWAAFCARVIEHLLKIHYWDRATEWVLFHWAQEAENFRCEMAKLVGKNPGLKSKYAEMFAEAWVDGRRLAVQRMTEYDVRRKIERKEKFTPKVERNKWDSLLPRECPYRFEHITAYGVESDSAGKEPIREIWPPDVARILNVRLEADYPIFTHYTPDRDPPQSRQPSRGFTWDR